MFDYQNPSLPAQQRAKDLLGRMTLEEKIDQLGCAFFNGWGMPDLDSLFPEALGTVGAMSLTQNVTELAQILKKTQDHIMGKSRFGIPALIHVEAITGGLFVEATSFPTAIAQASTWDPALIRTMADCIREQLVAVGYRHALSSVFDIGRDPRWGRLTETYGEDETLCAAMASAFVSGLQGEDEKRAVAATGKHFVGHGVCEGGLNMNQNNITERELREVHCKPFQAAISEARLMAVMNSYCNVNREPIISSKRILTDLLRGEMGFDGVLVSDYVSIDRLIDPYQITDNYVDAGVLALKAGLDVEYPAPNGLSRRLTEAIEDGRLDPALIDRSALRVLELKFKLGLFENPYPQMDRIQDAFHDQRSEEVDRRIAREAITLLKNEGNALPLSKDVKKIAVIGPHADRIRSLFGHYTYAAGIDMQEDAKNNESISSKKRIEGSAQGDGWFQRFPGEIRETPIYVEDLIRKAYPEAKTLFEAVRDYLPSAKVTTMMGISYTGNRLAGYEEALDLAADADVVILTLGGQNGWGVVATNGEGIDNANIGLPGLQEQFARDVFAANRNTVVIHIDGKPCASEYVCSHFPAVIEAWQLGQFGFEELVKVLFGDYNPAGRLPVTIARNAGVLPCYYGQPRGTGYISAGRFGVVSNRFGYVNEDVHPIYPFGHGLSYTQFEYRDLSVSAEKVPADGAVVVTAEIANTGARDGEEVVQLYVYDQLSSMIRPEFSLVGFGRVSIPAGETRKVSFNVPMSQLAFLDIDMNWKVEGGAMKFLLGASSADIRLEKPFEIVDDAFVDGKSRGFYTVAEVVE